MSASTYTDCGPSDGPARGHRVLVEPRWSDLDTLRHVNHAALVDLLSEGRLGWFKGDAAAHGSPTFKDPFVVASIAVDYRRPVTHGLPLAIEITVGRLGTRSLTLDYSGCQGGLLAISASTVVVPLHADGSPRELHHEERRYLLRYRSDRGESEPSTALPERGGPDRNVRITRVRASNRSDR